MLAQATKKKVMQPLWRQAPVVLARYASETLGLTGFRLRGLFGTAPLAATLERAIDWDALHDNLDAGRVEALALTATAVRTGRVTLFTEATSAVRRPAGAARPSTTAPTCAPASASST